MHKIARELFAESSLALIEKLKKKTKDLSNELVKPHCVLQLITLCLRHDAQQVSSAVCPAVCWRLQLGRGF